jgi:hypothetical protein
MSALGQKQTSGNVWMMSALPPKADIAGLQLDVRFVPITDIGHLRPDRATTPSSHHFVLSNAFSASRKISRICGALVESIMLALK